MKGKISCLRRVVLVSAACLTGALALGVSVHPTAVWAQPLPDQTTTSQTNSAQTTAAQTATGDLSIEVKDLALGGEHTCALVDSAAGAGLVYCWGHNDFDQTGARTLSVDYLPEQVPGLGSGVQAVAAGSRRTCALSAAGSVSCWGWAGLDDWGESDLLEAWPVPVDGLESGVRAIAMGGDYACALTDAGDVLCWMTATEYPTPEAVPGLGAGIQAVAVGGSHSCALTQGGGVKCWGSNNHGQLGDGTTEARSEPVDVLGLSSGVRAISVGAEHTCALKEDGSALCWGANGSGQIGNGTRQDRLKPTVVSGLGGGTAAIAAGSYHTCALITERTQCWGNNSTGQLGDGTTVERWTPVAVSGLDGAQHSTERIAAGGEHSCALLADEQLEGFARVRCWGSNDWGQLGADPNPAPQAVEGLGGAAIAVAAGAWHTCALMSSGSVQCWGHDQSGQLGDNGSSTRFEPQPVLGLDGGVKTVTAGAFHTCALLDNGHVQCWGDNSLGQLGDGSTEDHPLPVEVQGLGDGVEAVTAGAYTTCALAGGIAVCWGSGYGYAPVRVDGLPAGVKAIAPGWAYGCAITPAGAQCWGSNEYGQLGDGTNTAQPQPVNVIGLAAGADAISVDAYHTCAIVGGGAAKCWGADDFGQLGVGRHERSYPTPQDVVNLPGPVQAIVVGGGSERPGIPFIVLAAGHTCALTTVGGVYCWGNGEFGVLGNGVPWGSSAPVAVQGLAVGVQAIAAGYQHNCAVTAGGGVRCWGRNRFGQLGVNPGWTPVAVSASLRPAVWLAEVGK